MMEYELFMMLEVVMDKSFTQGLQYGATIYAEHDYVKVNGSQVNEKFI